MALPIYKSDDQTVTLLQTNWASQINPVISNPIVNGVLQKNISLTVGTNVINHKLSRNYQGYVITGMHNVFSQIYDTTSNTPSLTLNLHSSAATSVDIYCF
jgi:hypothetical protein